MTSPAGSPSLATSPVWRITLVVAISLLVAASVFVGLTLVLNKFEQKMLELTVSRLALTAKQIALQSETGLALKLQLAELQDLSSNIDRARESSGVQQIDISDERNVIVFSTNGAAIGKQLARINSSPSAQKNYQYQVNGDSLNLRMPLQNDMGVTVGQVILHESVKSQQEQLRVLGADILYSSLPLILVILLVSVVGVGGTLHFSKQKDPTATTRDPVRGLVLRLTVMTACLLTLASALALGYAFKQFKAPLSSQLKQTATSAASGLSAQITRALDYGIPLQQVRGLDEALRQSAVGHEEIASVIVRDDNGTILSQFQTVPGSLHTQDIELDLNTQEKRVAVLQVGLNPDYFAQVTWSVLGEVAPAMLVSLLVTVEILLLIVNASARRLVHPTLPTRALNPDKGDGNAETSGASAATVAPNLVFLRLPVFLLCISEEITRPFMPAYAQGLAAGSAWLPSTLVASAPVTVFMMVWALSQPIGAKLSRRWGQYRSFAVAAAIASLGLALSAGAESLLSLLIYRCLCAAGYGIALLCVQGIIIDQTNSSNRSRGMAHFIGALLAAGVCGPVIGGIVADEVGVTVTLLVAACVAIAGAGWLLWQHTSQNHQNTPASASSAGPTKSVTSIWALLRNRQFASLMLLSAMPTKIAATGILFCLIPLAFGEAGASNAEIGRIQMMYFVGYILWSPAVAALSDRWSKPRLSLLGGGLLTMVAMAPLLLSPTLGGALLAIAFFGVAQAFIGAPQLALLTQFCAHSPAAQLEAVAWHRLLERVGGAMGPLLAVGLAAGVGYFHAMILIGMICAACSLALWYLGRQQARSSPSLQPVL